MINKYKLERAEPKEMSEAREKAIEIIWKFEDLLEQFNIVIPDKEREGNKEEANIYGLNYWNLEDNITEIIEDEGEIK